jgi:dephospho-CoA kinase
VIIGLTGGIGSGKSVVGAMLAELGAHVIDTDKVGHRVYACGSDGWRQLVDAFGDGILAADGSIDRKRLAAIVFADPDRRSALNAIVHPLIFQEILRDIGERRAAGFTGHVVLEAPVLLEAKGSGMVDRIWVVTAPRDTVHARLAASRDLTPDEIEARMAAQLSDDERRASADVVIENTGDLEALRQRVAAAWASLQSLGS